MWVRSHCPFGVLSMTQLDWLGFLLALKLTSCIVLNTILVSCTTELLVINTIAGYVLLQMFHTFDVAVCWYCPIFVAGTEQSFPYVDLVHLLPIFSHCVWCPCPYSDHLLPVLFRFIPECFSFPPTQLHCLVKCLERYNLYKIVVEM